MRYLTVDGMLSGTGIRDSVNGGYLCPDDLGLSEDLKNRILEWLERYAQEHYGSFKDKHEITLLDQEGFKIHSSLKLELPNSKIEYYSAAKLKRLLLN